MTEHSYHLILTPQLKHDLEAVAESRGLTLAQLITDSLVKTGEQVHRGPQRRSRWSVSTQQFTLEGVAA